VLSVTSERILVQDADGRFVHVTEPFAWSFAARPRDMEGRRWQDLGPLEGVVEKLEELRIDALLSGRETTLEVPLGSSPYSFTATPLSGGMGEFDGTVLVARDLSERTGPEEPQRAEATHENYWTGTEGAAFIKDLDGRYIMVDLAGARFFGRPQEEIMGSTDAELFDDAETVLAMVESDRRTILSGKYQSFKQTMRLADETREFLVDKMPNVDAKGRITGIIVILRDITEKGIGRDPKARGEWFSSIIEKSPIAMGVSRDWNITFANSQYLKMFGHENLDELIGQPIAGQVAPEDRKKILESIQQMRGGPMVLEMIGLRKDGSRFPVQAAVAAVELPDGPALLGFFLDITERRRLEKRLSETKYESRAIYRSAHPRLSATTTTAAIGYLQLAEARLNLDDRRSSSFPAPCRSWLTVRSSSPTYRDLQKVEAGRERPEPIDVCRILREVGEAYRHPPGRQVEIVLHEAGSCMVMASSLIRGAFSNIVSNAIKHSDGDLQIKIAVSMLSRQGKGYIRVSIEDNGPGIPDERKTVIFDRSLMGLTKPVSRGLGLYLVKKLVEDFDGEVWVEDRVPGIPSEGAKFVVVLPAAEEREQSAKR